jgi:hypothetical protein
MSNELSRDFRDFLRREVKDAIRELGPNASDKGEERFPYPVMSILADEAIMPSIRALRINRTDDVQAAKAKFEWLQAVIEQAQYEMETFTRKDYEDKVEERTSAKSTRRSLRSRTNEPAQAIRGGTRSGQCSCGGGASCDGRAGRSEGGVAGVAGQPAR